MTLINESNTTTSYQTKMDAFSEKIWIEIGISYAIFILVSVIMFPILFHFISKDLLRKLEVMKLKPLGAVDKESLYNALRERMKLGLPVHLAQFGPRNLKLYLHHFLIITLPENHDGQITIQEYDAGWGAKLGTLLWGRVQLEYLTVEKLANKTNPPAQFYVSDEIELNDLALIRTRLDMRHGEPFWRSTFNNCEHYAQWVMTGNHRFTAILCGETVILLWELNILAYLSGKHCYPSCIRFMYGFRKQKWRMYNDVRLNLPESDEVHVITHPKSNIFAIAVVQKILSALSSIAFISFGSCFGHNRWAVVVGDLVKVELLGAVLFDLINLGYIYPILMTFIEHTFYKYDKECIGLYTLFVTCISCTVVTCAFLASFLACYDWHKYVVVYFPWANVQSII